MNPSPDPNPNPPGTRKSLFGALAGHIQINMDCIEEWDAAMEGVRWEAAALSESDEDLTFGDHKPPESDR